MHHTCHQPHVHTKPRRYGTNTMGEQEKLIQLYTKHKQGPVLQQKMDTIKERDEIKSLVASYCPFKVMLIVQLENKYTECEQKD